MPRRRPRHRTQEAKMASSYCETEARTEEPSLNSTRGIFRLTSVLSRPDCRQSSHVKSAVQSSRARRRSACLRRQREVDLCRLFGPEIHHSHPANRRDARLPKRRAATPRQCGAAARQEEAPQRGAGARAVYGNGDAPFERAFRQARRAADEAHEIRTSAHPWQPGLRPGCRRRASVAGARRAGPPPHSRGRAGARSAAFHCGADLPQRRADGAPATDAALSRATSYVSERDPGKTRNGHLLLPCH